MLCYDLTPIILYYGLGSGNLSGQFLAPLCITYCILLSWLIASSYGYLMSTTLFCRGQVIVCFQVRGFQADVLIDVLTISRTETTVV
jgi:hypothetical protein